MSRETRLLFIAGAMALASLWLLARIRFPERPVTPNPVPAVLGQLAAGPKFDDLADETADLFDRVQPSLVAFDAPPGMLASRSPVRRAAVRLRDDLAITTIPAPVKESNGTLLGFDAASGLAVVRASGRGPIAPLPLWIPRQLRQPRYVFATEISARALWLQPAFVASLEPVASALWSEPLWALRGATELISGSFLFTSVGELMGLVIDDGGRRVVVPGALLLSEAERLAASPPRPAGTPGIEVQELTPGLMALTGAARGVVVSWIDAATSETGDLAIGDVIEAAGGQAINTRYEWDVRVARLTAGEVLTLQVRHAGENRELSLVANAVGEPVPEASQGLGLGLRTRPKVGSDVVHVEPGAAAARAGLVAGDIITLIADVAAPTPAQVARSFAAMAPGDRRLLAVTRGGSHFVTALER